MDEIQKIKSLCDRYGIHPTKKLGQNFLIDARVAQMMVEAANLGPEDCVVEVGPGLGALTIELAKRVKKVVAVEIDQKLVEVVREIHSSYENVEVVQGDILKIQNSKFKIQNCRYKVVASLPYSITSAALRKFTEEEPRPSLIVVLVQKEVAQRVCAKPGQMSVLSVAVQYYGKPEIVALVPRTAFWPVPEVDSAILKIEIDKAKLWPAAQHESLALSDRELEKRLFQLVRIGFSSRRKQLQNNLVAGLRLPREVVVTALTKVGLASTVRAQELAVEKWIELARFL